MNRKKRIAKLSCIIIAVSLAAGWSSAQCASYAPGETVYCAPTGSANDWRTGTVVENNPAYAYVRVKCGPGKNGSPGGFFMVNRKDMQPGNGATGQERVDPGKATSGAGAAVGQVVRCMPTGSPGDVRIGKVVENNPALNYVRIECPAAGACPGGVFIVSRKDILSADSSSTSSASSPSSAGSLTTTVQSTPVSSGNAATGVTPPAKSPQNGNSTEQKNAVQCACASDNSEIGGDSLEANAKRTIAGRYVRNGGALDAAHTPATVRFESFRALGSRPYAMPVPGAYYTGSPDGPGGKMGTIVHEIATKYSVCIDYPGFARTGYKGRVHIVDHDATYKCFIDVRGQWACNQSADKMTTRDRDK